MNSAKLTDIINAGEYELSSWGWYPDPDPSSILADFTCDQRPPDGSTYGNNDAYYCDPEYDRLYQEQLQQTDANARWDIVHQMQKMFYEDSPYAIMWYDPIFSAWRADRFEGYIPQPQPNGDPLEGWGGISEVYLSLKPVAGAGRSSSREHGRLAGGLGDPGRGHHPAGGRVPDPPPPGRRGGRVEDRRPEGREKTGWERAATSRARCSRRC